MNTCFFIGHRDTSEDIYPVLEAEVERHITEYGVDEFIVGHYGRFDQMTARAVKAAKTTHPDVKLIMLMPYINNIPLPEGFDGAVYPDGLETVPKKYAIPRANQAMVDRCDNLIAYVKYPFGGAFRCLEYAKRREIWITNIANTENHPPCATS